MGKMKGGKLGMGWGKGGGKARTQRDEGVGTVTRNVRGGSINHY